MRGTYIWALSLLAWSASPAAIFRGTVTDRDGAPVGDAAIVLVPTDGSSPAAGRQQAAPRVMDQVGQQFDPHVLVIGKGDQVAFPNSDTVAHQVYSFSPVKRFSLGLYRGLPYAPVEFDEPGLIVLGCNIHDSMVAYIFVAESQYFGKSNDRGEVEVSGVPAGTYAVKAWTPRFKEQEPRLLQQFTLKADETAAVELKLDGALAPKRTAPAKHGKLRY
ncbi:MAG: methylamine utilization protein [Steroidobacteraceae bacterium]